MKKGLTYISVFLLFYTLTFVLGIILTWKDFGIMLSIGIYISVLVLQAAILAITRRHILKRTIVKEGAGYLVLPIGLLMSATMVTASIERASTDIALPGWTSTLGIVLLFIGYFIAISAFNASSPHAAIRYSEQASEESRGPYDVIRCPVELSAIFITISIPLYFGSLISLIPAVLSIILIIIEAARKDHWRFVNYEYYYEYTKTVSYVLIPLIW